MNRRTTWAALCALAAVAAAAVVVHRLVRPDASSTRPDARVDATPAPVSRETIDAAERVERHARTFPDFVGVAIPPNLCPVNFVVEEPGRRCYARIASSRGEAIEVTAETRAVRFPPDAWRRLLDANRGEALTLTVAVEDVNGRWQRFRDVTDARIARENVDRYLVYRIVGKCNQTYRNIGIHQRDLAGYDETTLIHSTDIGRGCMNCHTFADRRPSTMVMHVRSKLGGGMLLVRDGKIARVDTRSRFNPTPAKYIALHPSGKLAAFAESKLVQFEHTIGENVDVWDAKSDLGLYRFDTNTVTTTPAICTPTRQETYPSWSPDGRTLYFSSAPAMPPQRWKNVRYDLMRIAYDVETDRWGELETVLSTDELGLSMTHPRVSPDGRWLLFSASAYGSFPVWHADSDLYLMDLDTRRVRPLKEVNSDEAEAWHTWSSNGRWIVFSSRRRDGVLTKPYLSHFDAEGNASTPLVLPQQDPTFYDRFLHVYNLPEFAVEPVGVTRSQLIEAVRSSKAVEAKLAPGVTPRVSAEEVPRETPKTTGIE